MLQRVPRALPRGPTQLGPDDRQIARARSCRLRSNSAGLPSVVKAPASSTAGNAPTVKAVPSNVSTSSSSSQTTTLAGGAPARATTSATSAGWASHQFGTTCRTVSYKQRVLPTDDHEASTTGRVRYYVPDELVTFPPNVRRQVFGCVGCPDNGVDTTCCDDSGCCCSPPEN
jgi:hypothetical protein